MHNLSTEYTFPKEYLLSGEELAKSYPAHLAKNISQYKPIDTHLVVHDDDPDLKPLKIPLARLIVRVFQSLWGRDIPIDYEDLFPKIETIDGFGLPPKEQRFKVQKIPTKLQSIINNSESVEDAWIALEKNRSFYRDEIKWIAIQWHRRLYGYYCYINGKLTYIDGWQYLYDNFWKIDIGIPDYRSRDRKFFLFARFCYVTTDAYFIVRITDFKKQVTYTNNQKEIKQAYKIGHTIEEGPFWVDYEKRVCVGFNYPKHRREGATYKAELINYEIVSRTENINGGIQSMNGTKAEEAFKKHLVHPFQKLLFIFKPTYEGTDDPAAALKFGNAAHRAKNGKNRINSSSGLKSKIIWMNSAAAMAFDSYKLHVFHDDEIGKLTMGNDCYERHQVTYKCLTQGNGASIHGFTIKTSTVGEMSSGGGKRMLTLCKESKIEETRKNGQTITGLYNLFIPAYDGLEGFVDEFGNSVIEDPETPVVSINGTLIRQGSKKFLEEKSAAFRERGDTESQLAYNQDLREHPRRFSHCFLSSAGDTGMNVAVLSSRIQELTFNLSLQPIQGNLEWIDSRNWHLGVRWEPNQTGKFHISRVLDPREANNIIYNGESYMPKHIGKMIASGDPFKFGKIKDGQRLSKGGGAVFYPFDSTLDAPTDDVKHWQSNRFVCDYLERVDVKEEYFEDMLKMCIYFGALFYPENNLPEMYEWFINMGFDGMLLYPLDHSTKTPKDRPGFNSNETTKQQLFLEVKNYIEKFGFKEKHINILNQCAEIQGLEEMTMYDLFTAAGGCLLGASLPQSYFDALKEAYGINYYNEEEEDMDKGLSVFYPHLK